MKKIVVIVLFFALLGNSGYAQNDFRFGFQASPSFSWMNTNDNQINGNGTNLGFKLGVVAENYFQERYALTFGLGFSFNAGGTLKHETGGDFWANSELNNVSDYHALPEGVNLKYSLQYLEIPVGFKMTTQEFGYMKFYAHLPIFTLGILTQAKGDIPNLIVPVEGLDIKKDVNFVTLSWGLGGGMEYSIGENTSLYAGIRFQNSFIDVTKDKNALKFEYDDVSGEPIRELDQPEDSKGNIGSITINLGVMF